MEKKIKNLYVGKRLQTEYYWRDKTLKNLVLSFFFFFFPAQFRQQSPRSKLPEAQKKVPNREIWLRPSVSTVLSCFYCPSSSHSLECPVWGLPFSGINFTFLTQLRRIVECKIVSPETTELSGGRSEGRRTVISLKTGPIRVVIHSVLLCIMIICPSQPCL